MMEVELLETTNPTFKYLQGSKVKVKDFRIGLIIWFGDFHTSLLQKIEYKYCKNNKAIITAHTLNSVYKFKVKE